MVLTCLNTNPELLKFSASLGKGWVEVLGTNPIAWCPVSHTGTVQWVVGYQVWPDWCMKKGSKSKKLHAWAFNKKVKK